MIYADSRPQIEAKRKAFFRSVVAGSLEEVGDKLFIFTHNSESSSANTYFKSGFGRPGKGNDKGKVRPFGRVGRQRLSQR